MVDTDKATTLSVMQMGKLLGLGKTESYWLVHKNYFDTIMVAGQMRVLRADFENWYAHQTHYRKVNGPEPGASLTKEHYSIKEIMEMLALSKDAVHCLVRKARLPIIRFPNSNAWFIPVDEFERWFTSQSHYQKGGDRKQNQQMMQTTISIPEFGRILGLKRHPSYHAAEQLKDELTIIEVAGHKRITKDSFEKWYSNQTTYAKPMATSPEPDKLALPQKDSYTITEVADMLECSELSVRGLIHSGKLTARKIGTAWRIRHNDLMEHMSFYDIEQ